MELIDKMTSGTVECVVDLAGFVCEWLAMLYFGEIEMNLWLTSIFNIRGYFNDYGVYFDIACLLV